MSAPASANRPALVAACANCGHAFAAPPPRYCSECGQETTVQAPTVSEFMQQFSGTYFATEGALWRTLRLLVFKPGELTLQYLAGRRKHYVLPLRLFLSITVIMLLTMRLMSMIQFAAVDDAVAAQSVPARPHAVQLGLRSFGAGFENGSFYCHRLPAWLCQRARSRLDVDTTTMMMEAQRATERVASHAGVVMFLLLPAFAGGLALLFRDRGMRYTEHLVFALHLHAFWFLTAALMMLELPPLILAGAVLVPLYGWLALRRVYGGRAWVLMARAAVLGLGHAALIAAAVIATLVAALLW